MNREYDIFEILPNGDVLWRDSVHGMPAVHPKLLALAAETTNELVAMVTLDKQIVDRVNARAATVEKLTEQPTAKPKGNAASQR